VINHRQKLAYIAAILDVRFGSLAVIQHSIRPMAASGRKPDVQPRIPSTQI
jgi:hypothetical protein